MTAVTPASLVYVATQVSIPKRQFFSLFLPITQIIMEVRFALSSSPVFSRTDQTTDSERFYTSLLDVLNDASEQEETRDLLLWWNR
jgi:hypothetical protein